jgi:DNA (cytosine-5)-methyltransferase 1|tara:strand:+ start:42 stop:656 length:615 start_codon:yes stop_codon:yes gene_type:complete
MIKVLNLYAGIGGNRKLWKGVEVTAIENNKSIAKIYKDFFPKDKVIIADAHKFLLEHYKEFDFIWSSPPCPSHSRMNFSYGIHRNRKYPNMKLYEEIIFLKYWFKGKWIVENVISYYEPLITPYLIQGHYIWTNMNISSNEFKGKRLKVRNDVGQTIKVKMKEKNIFIKDFHNYKGDKRTLLNNAIEPEFGLYLFNKAFEDVIK